MHIPRRSFLHEIRQSADLTLNGQTFDFLGKNVIIAPKESLVNFVLPTIGRWINTCSDVVLFNPFNIARKCVRIML